MNIIKKLLIPVAVAAVVSLGLIGCNKKDQKSEVKQSSKGTVSNEHPTNEHPTNEHPTGND